MQRALSTEITAKEAMNATGDVTDEGDGMKLSHLDYVAMQSVDVPALNADIALGGIDQRGIYMVARDRLPSIGEEKPTCIFTPLLTGLQGGKMSSSNVSSKIGVMNQEEDVYDKIEQAYCPAEDLEGNGVMEYIQHLVFPVLESWEQKFEVEREEEYGGNVTYNTYDELEDHFVGEHPEHSDSLHPADLKQATAGYISQYLENTREESDINLELQQKAFPEEN
jgi:tyrosyl-tRNA synthetase